MVKLKPYADFLPNMHQNHPCIKIDPKAKIVKYKASHGAELKAYICGC